jgi:hypothetical protein
MIFSKLLAQNLPPLPEDVNIYTNVSNQYLWIRSNLHPSYYVRTAVNTLLGLAGVAAFIWLLWGGLQWITAGNDKDAVEKARKRIVNALLGLTVVFSSYAILFILRVLFNVDLIGFNISQLGGS